MRRRDGLKSASQVVTGNTALAGNQEFAPLTTRVYNRAPTEIRMPHQISVDDAAFRDAFIAGSIAPAQFHHREHLRLAYIFQVEYGARAGVELRRALQDFLQQHGIDRAKYHETLITSLRARAALA